MQKLQPKLKSAIDLEQRIKDLDLRSYRKIIGKKTKLAETIYECRKLPIEDKITAYRLAEAFDRYIFSMKDWNISASESHCDTYPNRLAKAFDRYIFSEWDISASESHCDAYTNADSLDDILNKLHTSEPMCKTEKINILLDLLPQVVAQQKLKDKARKEELKNENYQELFFIVCIAIFLEVFLRLITVGHLLSPELWIH